MKPALAKKLLAQTVENYSAIAEDWHQSRQGKFWPDILFFQQYVKTGDQVLDVGCGNGRFLAVLEDRDIECTGLDNCQPLLDIAQDNFKGRAKFVKGDVLDLPFTDSRFSVVVCIAVLHHIPSKQLRKQAISELKRVLKPGGTLILAVWDIYNKLYLKLVLKYFFLKIFGFSQMDFKDVLMPFNHRVNRYLHGFTQKEFKRLAESAKLKILETGRSQRTKRGNRSLYIICQK
ncbi:MAG: class I SAM-dependent methyltransferase [bacterium]